MIHKLRSPVAPHLARSLRNCALPMVAGNYKRIMLQQLIGHDLLDHEKVIDN
jgi:hypothetical protein